MTMLQTEALPRRFGDFTVVDRLSLEVADGEVFGLLGPNGAGKSTAIKMLTTLPAPTSGRAWVAGYDLVRQASQVRCVIGYVPPGALGRRQPYRLRESVLGGPAIAAGRRPPCHPRNQAAWESY